MHSHRFSLLLILFLGGIFVLISGCGGRQHSGKTYDDLVAFFEAWREFEKPNFIEGVPDYTAPAMSEQRQQIPEFKRRLESFDTSDWTISERADYEVVRTEINGLDFYHRVLRPWSRNPVFYAVIQMYEQDVPGREGVEIDGVLNVWKHEFPLNETSQAVFRSRLNVIPAILAQAMENLTEEAGDLWYFGIRQKRRESGQLENLAMSLEDDHPDLAVLAREAKAAVDDFTEWLETGRESMEAFSGVGEEAYSWYMKEVKLVPYSWEEQLALLQRELERSLAGLAFEEHRNRNLDPLKPAESLRELQRRSKKYVNVFMDFLRNKSIFTVPDYMNLDDEAHPSSFIPEDRRDFFPMTSYLNPLPLLCHQVHWLEKQRELRNTHPIRRHALLYNIWDSRAEGLATGFEELMMQAGLLENDPRARELVYILLAFRCVRAIGELKLHSGEFTLEQAIAYAEKATPRSWIKPWSNTIRGDYGIYLSQPGYGTSYVVGKNQLERLIADRAAQQGNAFTLKAFFDDYFSLGFIPASLIRWEMTGLDDEMQRLWN